MFNDITDGAAQLPVDNATAMDNGMQNQEITGKYSLSMLMQVKLGVAL